MISPPVKEGGIKPPRHGGSDEVVRIFGNSLIGKKLLDFSISINPLGPPSGLMETLTRALKTIPSYPEIDAKTLTGEIAALHNLSPRHIIVGNGSTDLLFSLIPLLPHKRAVIPYPSFIEYERVCEIYGWHILHVPPADTDRFALDTRAILSNIVSHTTLFLCQPNNPTGQCLESEALESILDKAEKQGTFVILDEAFLPFTERPSAIPWVSRHESLIILRSMTKSYGIPGLRLGYAVAAPGIISRWKSYLPPWNVNALAQAAGIYCLQDGGVHLKKSKVFIYEERQRLMDGINRLSTLHSLPSEANFFLVSIESETLSADDLYLSLGKRGILVRHCGSFRGMGNHHIRIGIKNREDNQALLSALRDIVSSTPISQAEPRQDVATIS